MRGLRILFVLVAFSWCEGVFAANYTLDVAVESPLTFPRTPISPVIDFAAIARESGLEGVLDPASIQVVDTVTNESLPVALSEDFAYAGAGHVGWVVRDPTHTNYRIHFSLAPTRPAAFVPEYVPQIGDGDLLRFNAGAPRPIVLPYVSGLADLTGDGIPDLLGTWNYAHRPGMPWDGVVCYPGTDKDRFLFADMIRARHVTGPDDTTPQFFETIYMSAAFADFDGDGLLDMVYSPSGGEALGVYHNTGIRDPGGVPRFTLVTELTRPSGLWGPCRAADLDGDGALDIVVGGNDDHAANFLRNKSGAGFPRELDEPVPLDVDKNPCFFDVDSDGRLDAIGIERVSLNAEPPGRLLWRRGEGGMPPAFAAPQPLPGSTVERPDDVCAMTAPDTAGLLVLSDNDQRVTHLPFDAATKTFGAPRVAQSLSAVMSLSDQAWPFLCDWDNDGDTDILIGGGYGWPRIVINEGTREKPAFAEPRSILAAGSPIRLLRNDLLGEPKHWHNMGYSYPAFVDWDGDGVGDLLLPNETNRIYWYKNSGTPEAPAFGERRQLEVDGYPESDEAKQRSAERAVEAVYPLEAEQPFFWRTGASFADWNGDGLMDLATLDGATRELWLFARYRDAEGALRLRRDRPLTLDDGRHINDAIVERAAHWTESFRDVDWDGDGLLDLVYSCAGTDPAKGSIYLLRNTGAREHPRFAAPRTLCCFGEPIKVTAHGPHPAAGDFDGDGFPDIVACVEWSVYPFFSHAAIEMNERPRWTIGKPIVRE